MKNYFCPICKGHLWIDDYIIFSVKSPENKQGLILLSTKIGDYFKKTHPDFEIVESKEYKFYCSICHAKLNDKEIPNMVKISMEEEGKIYDCFFSSIAGELVSYKVKEQEIEQYGFHKDRCAKYFDVPEEYKKYL